MPKLFGRFNLLRGIIFFFGTTFQVLAQANQPAQKSNGVGKMENGQKVGEWIFYYPDGQLMAREQYKEGMLDGICLAYFPNGQLASKENWKEDLQEDSSWYYHPNGKIFRKGIYNDGVYQGTWLTFYENGRLQQSCPYLDGLPNGFCKNWYETGRLQEIGRYMDGKKSGQFVFYFPEKEIPSLIAQYWNDTETGLWVTLDKKGRIKKLEQFSTEGQ
ncbi:MAG TPA: toxin-antitoxin system YwqK family antitoxin [Catalimonadaceae bacterium]|nr:toxin-antitoxin system YwqK family antitoxin [Catalimonadaceae bacterium]